MAAVPLLPRVCLGGNTLNSSLLGFGFVVFQHAGILLKECCSCLRAALLRPRVLDAHGHLHALRHLRHVGRPRRLTDPHSHGELGRRARRRRLRRPPRPSHSNHLS